MEIIETSFRSRYCHLPGEEKQSKGDSAMGQRSEDVEDGVVCKRCHTLLIGEGDSPVGRPVLCEDCEREEQEKGKGGPLRPGWLPR